MALGKSHCVASDWGLLLHHPTCPRAYHTLPENIQQGMAMLLLWVIGFELLNLYESPKYLMGRRKNAAAVEIVHKVTL